MLNLYLKELYSNLHPSSDLTIGKFFFPNYSTLEDWRKIGPSREMTGCKCSEYELSVSFSTNFQYLSVHIFSIFQYVFLIYAISAIHRNVWRDLLNSEAKSNTGNH
uniref:Uncharacterized protein n=1 Tax=Micrurus corallinus TaxID=54390 RepID=A0A2D4F3W4_MICCO